MVAIAALFDSFMGIMGTLVSLEGGMKKLPRGQYPCSGSCKIDGTSVVARANSRILWLRLS